MFWFRFLVEFGFSLIDYDLHLFSISLISLTSVIQKLVQLIVRSHQYYIGCYVLHIFVSSILRRVILSLFSLNIHCLRLDTAFYYIVFVTSAHTGWVAHLTQMVISFYLMVITFIVTYRKVRKS